jgi:hypothetical protein
VRGRSCLTNLLTTVETMSKKLDRGENVEACFLDLSKAFDTVNHRYLIHKLEAYGVADNAMGWIRSFLCERTMQVRVRDAVSNPAPVTSGVPQGSVLGPLLFLIFINDMPEGMANDCLLFADDIKIISSVERHQSLQEDLDKVCHWAKSWDLSINHLKSQHLSSDEVSHLSIQNGDTTLSFLPKCSSASDLGVLTNATLLPSEQCFQAAKRARREFYTIRRCFSKLTVKNFPILFGTFVRPHLEYGVQAWSPYLSRDINHLENVQRQATRCVRGLRHLTYEARLTRMKLFSMRRRRLRGDLIEAFKIIKQIDKVDSEYFFQRSHTGNLRGNPYKLYKPRVLTRNRLFSFSIRVISPWNKLPAEVVTAKDVTQFKNMLDKCWSQLFPDYI